MNAASSYAKPVSNWLFLVCALIFIMVVVGGITRLTESGLSITQWKPISGIVPPLSAEQWQAEFDLYQQIPEYQKINKGMSLDEYKTIYWWEYAHRLLGRLIGLVFALPLFWFWWRGRLENHWKAPLSFLLFLGALQGCLGWYMVQSGLVDRTDVSQYRLTAHLTLAAIIFAATFWVALDIRSNVKIFARPARHKFWVPAWILFCLFWITFIMGGFMAGTDAGLAFDSFPTYNGQWLPDGIGVMQPWYINIFENPTAIHFVHRSLAEGLFLLTWIFGLYLLKHKPKKQIKIPLFHVLAMVTIQAILGITTITTHVHLHVAASHQAGSILLLSFFVWLLHRLRTA